VYDEDPVMEAYGNGKFTNLNLLYSISLDFEMMKKMKLEEMIKIVDSISIVEKRV
jgi:hypothetical protein